MAGDEIDRLIAVFARLPGLGPRSARRIVLSLLKRRETRLIPLADALIDAAENVRQCSVCGNYGHDDPCAICADQTRDDGLLCVVEDVAGLWAMERAGLFKGRYHVLGGILSALDGVGPEDLGIDKLLARAGDGRVREVILATGATVDGQSTAHYIAERLAGHTVLVSALAHGVPMGGELDFLDDGTIEAALRARRALS
ncbi:MAG: recombination mediator RecR [Rhodospirillaceae bacterium]|nr:recombination mediator RecR [Rhodospirillaceae bacterium]